MGVEMLCTGEEEDEEVRVFGALDGTNDCLIGPFASAVVRPANLNKYKM